MSSPQSNRTSVQNDIEDSKRGENGVIKAGDQYDWKRPWQRQEPDEHDLEAVSDVLHRASPVG